MKQVMEKLTPVFAFDAKTKRDVTRRIDKGLRVFSVLSVAAGFYDAGAKHHSLAFNDFRTAYSTGALGFGNFTEKLSLDSAHLQGFAGEKVVGIVNKIMHKSA